MVKPLKKRGVAELDLKKEAAREALEKAQCEAHDMVFRTGWDFFHELPLAFEGRVPDRVIREAWFSPLGKRWIAEHYAPRPGDKLPYAMRKWGRP